MEIVIETNRIDGPFREKVMTKLKVLEKRTLRMFRYPPDQQKLATEIVIKQAELMAEGDRIR